MKPNSTPHDSTQDAGREPEEGQDATNNNNNSNNNSNSNNSSNNQNNSSNGGGTTSGNSGTGGTGDGNQTNGGTGNTTTGGTGGTADGGATGGAETNRQHRRRTNNKPCRARTGPAGPVRISKSGRQTGGNQMKSIGWIGVGIMGKPMVRNLQKAGYTLHIYARNREKVADVIQEGAIFHDTIGDCAQGRDAVITMVGFPKDVEEVYFAPGNILDRADPGTYLIDMTTISPALAQRIFQQGRQRGLRVLDAPVTGGDIGARAGTLSILVGGEAADYQACRPLLAAMGTNLSHQGPARPETACQTINKSRCGTLSGLCEGLRYAQAKGLDGRKLLGHWPRGRQGSKQMDLWRKNSRPETVPGGFPPAFYQGYNPGPGSPRTWPVPGGAGAGAGKLPGFGGTGAGGPGNPGPYGSLPSGGVTGLLRRGEDGEKRRRASWRGGGRLTCATPV